MLVALNTNLSNEFSIGSFEAKTHFSELLRKVEEGFLVRITRNGKEIAVMQNASSVKNQKSIQAWNNIKSIINQNNINEKITISDIIEWRNDGRK